MKRIKKIMALFSSLSIIFACGCSNSNTPQSNIVYYNSANSYSQTPENIENNQGESYNEENLKKIPTVPASLNEPAEISDISVKLTNVYNVGTIEENIYSDDKKQAIAFVLEVTNNTDSEINVNQLDLSLNNIDGEGAEITSDILGIMLADEKLPDLSPLNANLKPGETTKGFSTISIYPKWENLTLYFSTQDQEDQTAISFYVTNDMVETIP